MPSVPIETTASMEISQVSIPQPGIAATKKTDAQIHKDAIRKSLKASTLDGVFAGVFGVTTNGILLSNFLLELNASPVVFGMLSSIPMLVNLIQPLGAYFSERSQSRFYYSLQTNGIARLIWLILAFSIIVSNWIEISSQKLVILTLLVVLFSHLLAGLGSSSWLSWLAVLVPRRLRGRYFGIRNSAGSLTNLLSVPLMGLVVSNWYSGTLQGYGVVLLIGIVFGIISLGCQYFKIDVNPALQNTDFAKSEELIEAQSVNKFSDNIQTVDDKPNNKPAPSNQFSDIWNNFNFLKFLLYFGLWMLSINMSTPFFNFYMLEQLNLDVSCVTLYGSLQAGANLLLVILWGKLADKIGNRRILIWIGILVALTPLLWMGVSADSWSIWLWLPLLHIFLGGTWSAVDLCNNNMQLEIAPIKNQSIYFAIASAVGGVSAAVGTTIGSLIVEFTQQGGLILLFAISCGCRFLALIPLFFVKEPHQ